MSYNNYDVLFNLSFDENKKHNELSYEIHFPYYDKYYYPYSQQYKYSYAGYFNFDESGESLLENYLIASSNYYFTLLYGYHNKLYLRNPMREAVTFTQSNCNVRIKYGNKVPFGIKWRSTGFVNSQNPSFYCSTVYERTYQQYEWTEASVCWKLHTEDTWNEREGTISGTWSDVRIDTDIVFEDGYVYDVKIHAKSDDGTYAYTPIAQFVTTDGVSITNCITPSGTFTNGIVDFVWSHSTEYGTPQYAYDLQYSNNNGSSWTTVANHIVSSVTTTSITLTDAGAYRWRVRTYNSNDVAGNWAEATFVNQVPAMAPTNLQITTEGRPTVSWASVSQRAYQVQFLLSDSIVYDSGAVYTTETNHYVNQYFDDTRAYVVRVRIYNGTGEVSDWTEAAYQQPEVSDVEFTVTANEDGGAIITVTPSNEFVKYFVLRNNKPIAQMDGETYIDNYAVGFINYSVVGVTSDDHSDIQTNGLNVTYPHATLVAQNGQKFQINKRVDIAYEIRTSNQADIGKANFIGDKYPSHYPSEMRLKSFSVSMFDDQRIVEGLLGTLVFYADNFGNGGYCMVTAYEKSDNFVKNGQGIYANEVSLTLEVTNYDDSIKYPI